MHIVPRCRYILASNHPANAALTSSRQGVSPNDPTSLTSCPSGYALSQNSACLAKSSFWETLAYRLGFLLVLFDAVPSLPS